MKIFPHFDYTCNDNSFNMSKIFVFFSLFPDIINKECSIGVISFCVDLGYMGTVLCEITREHF